ncbi:hypothetical protein H4R35_000752 [Dimargaris xerosporica]|nr:hypothetical protein H4R35_000752 [Dimargaris xerosporica]
MIPARIDQALKLGKPKMALELAEQFSQIPDIMSFAENYNVDVPNYFEFIMLYAAIWGLGELDTFLPDAQKKIPISSQFYNVK